MNERIKKLREQTLNTQPFISEERAVLVTELYKTGALERYSSPVARALTFKHILENKKLCVNEGELIVGERGPAPKATPTYPEICTHTENDLEILNDREKISFKVNAAAKSTFLKDIKPYWEGKSIRDRIFEEVDDEWKETYAAGVFTEFMEQRAPGHTVLGDVIYRYGLKDLRIKIKQSIEQLDFYSDDQSLEKREQLKAMDIAAQALINFSKRYADELERLAQSEQDAQRKTELETMAANCREIPENPPKTFWQSLQYYWFVHLGVITELNTWDSFNPGRIDRNLYPFYKRDIENGILTKDTARELLQSFWIKFNNQPAPPKVGVTAKESNTYTDFCLINVGGLTTEGQDSSNELSYLVLDVIEEMRLLQPSSMVQISRKNPDRLLKRALQIIKTGYGQPSLFNTDAIIAELIRQGKSIEDARDGGASGCVEAGAFGRESYILTGYFNLPKVLEITLHNGFDPRTNKQLGPRTGEVESFASFDQLYEAFKTQLDHFIDIKIKGNRIIEKLYAKNLPAPFLSLFIDDCIEQGKDYNAGGARYNSSYIQGVGIASVTDAFTAIKYQVFDRKNVEMVELMEALNNNFEGFDQLHDQLINGSPKYGNDDDYADDILCDVFDSYFQFVDGRPNTKGGHYRINLLPTTVHVYFGSVISAMPDGRLAGVPLSEGISPVQGADRKGPTSVLKSASKIDHLRTGGTLLNQKFTPQILEDENGINKLVHLIRSYFRMDGHHIQFNVVTADMLRKAQQQPEEYRDLIVRVAGYSDYFVDLTEELQNEIILRTEHVEY